MANSFSKNTHLTEFYWCISIENILWYLLGDWTSFVKLRKSWDYRRSIVTQVIQPVMSLTRTVKDTTVIPAQAQTLTWSKFSNIFWSLSQDTPVNQIQSTQWINKWLSPMGSAFSKTRLPPELRWVLSCELLYSCIFH